MCAVLVTPDTNGEIIATEWFIRAGGGGVLEGHRHVPVTMLKTMAS